jgi:L-ascorbate metabolism protein UlaG (beta-lactamase superfamily)
MTKSFLFLALFILITAVQTPAYGKYEKDVYETSTGKLTIHFIGHASLILEFKGKVIHVDPCSMFGDYSILPKADIILITHNHPDHFDKKTIELISKKKTQIVLNSATFDELKKGFVMKNGDKKTLDGIVIEAVPAYNTTAGREMYHPKGRDNGFILTIGKKRIYIAGDTENTPEMNELKNIDIAFLPMNQPYTMVPEQVADAAGKFKPKILYPYHYGETDISKLVKLMQTNKDVELKIRKLQ